MNFEWHDCYSRYINLSYRTDRRIHMEQELKRAGLNIKRYEAIITNHYNWDGRKYGVMLNRTPNACGCYQSQVNVMRDALDKNLSAWVNEDDLIYCSDMKERLDYIQKFLNNQEDWSVCFMGGTFHVNPAWWHKEGHSPDLQMCGCNLKRDAECTDDPRIMRTYGAFSTHSYIVNVNWIERILKYFDENVHLSMGIDWLFIKMQPQLKAFAFVPGCVKQMDNISDIGNGMTVFSGFARLGPYWWQDRMEQFNPSTYNWAECKI